MHVMGSSSNAFKIELKLVKVYVPVYDEKSLKVYSCWNHFFTFR